MRIVSLLPVLAVVGGLGAVGVAGASEEVTLYAADANGYCFTTEPNKPACDEGEHPRVTLHTGDTLTWDFTSSKSIHNAAAENDVAGDPAWKGFKGSYLEKRYSYRFTAPGTYEFVCQVHANQNMRGTVVVEGDPVEPIPTATRTATPTPAVTAGFVPAPAPPSAPPAAADDHTRTPAPGRTAEDADKPRLASVRVRRSRSGLRLRFRLSEPATVAIEATRRGSRRVLASKVVQSPAGTHALTLRSRALRRKGRYRVTFAPVDAMANRGVTVKRGVRVK